MERCPREHLRASVKHMGLAFRFSLLGVALLVPGVAKACAVCGTGPGVEGDPTIRGFYWGLLFLMAMPFAVAGSIGAWLFYRAWRANAPGWRSTLNLHALWAHKEIER